MSEKKHSTGKNINRREFLAGAAAAAAFTFVPKSVFGQGLPASERLNLACIGACGRGYADILGLERHNWVAFCDVIPERDERPHEKYPDTPWYTDYRQMLDKHEKEIDAVIVAPPDHCHAPAALNCICRGKHVYVEKPMTWSVEEARLLCAEVKKYKVASQMGNQGHAGEGTHLFHDYITGGHLGAVKEVHVWTNRPVGYWKQGIARPTEAQPVPKGMAWELWHGPCQPRPFNQVYHPGAWRGWVEYGTGALGDMGAHLIDAPFWALNLGLPSTVEATFTEFNGESWPASSKVVYEFPARGEMPACKLTWYDGGQQPERPADLEEGRRMGNKDGGILVIGDKGKMVSSCYGNETRLIPESYMQQVGRIEKKLERSPGHYQEFVRACKGGKPAASNFDYSSRLTEMMIIGCIAIRAGRKLTYEPETMSFKGDAEATSFLKRPSYREGWTIKA